MSARARPQRLPKGGGQLGRLLSNGPSNLSLKATVGRKRRQNGLVGKKARQPVGQITARSIIYQFTLTSRLEVRRQAARFVWRWLHCFCSCLRCLWMPPSGIHLQEFLIQLGSICLPSSQWSRLGSMRPQSSELGSHLLASPKQTDSARGGNNNNPPAR